MGAGAVILADRVEALAARNEFRGERVLADVVNQCREPLRVAITGDVSAGKSTLLNAIVGSRIAKVQRAETTSVVTWYRAPGLPEPVRLSAGQECETVSFDLSDRVVLADTPGSNTVSGAQKLTDELMRGASDAVGMASVMLFLVRDGELSGLGEERVREFSTLITGDLGLTTGVVLVGGKADLLDEEAADTEARLRAAVPGLPLRAVAVSQQLAAGVRCGTLGAETLESLRTIVTDPALRTAAALGWHTLRQRWLAAGLDGDALTRLEANTGTLRWLLDTLPNPLTEADAGGLTAALARASRYPRLDGILRDLADDADVFTVNAATCRLRRRGAALGGQRYAMIDELLGGVRREPFMVDLRRRAAGQLIESPLFDHVPAPDRQEAVALLRDRRPPASLDDFIWRWRSTARTPGLALVRDTAATVAALASAPSAQIRKR